MRIQPLSRRTFLRGLGVAMALPWLEQMAPAARAAAAASGPAGPAAAPQRFAFIYTPNGYNQSTFLPKATGAAWELTPALQPLAAVKDDVTLVTGLDRAFAPGTGVHAQCGACWLTSSPPGQTLDGGFPTNVTLDQMLARRVGTGTLLPSVELSCNDHADNRETKYFESISWYGPGYAANTEKNPRSVFRRLFGRAGGGPAKSVLDAVTADAASLRTRLGGADRARLDEYLDSVRAVERRIQTAERLAATAERPPIGEPAGIPERRGEYLRLMGDLVVLAFRQDLTRVATIVVDPERWDSPRMYHGVFDKPQNHHVLTHTKGDEAKAKLAEIDRFHVAFFAYVAERLKAAHDAHGSLLDSTVLAMGSGISDGDTHNYHDLEVLLAGRGGGIVRPGRHLHYAGDRPLADLWLSLLRGGGADAPRFADSTGVLTELAG
ncbi:MAG TPA: DUF1552 domain-containing protein [Humisphaera sp.]